MEQFNHFNLNQYIKYCLGYLSLTKPTGFKRSSPVDIKLPQQYFSILNFINGDLDGKLSEDLNLELYYNTNPKDITEETRSEYENQKELARRVQEIHNKYKNDSFTKESVLRFGCFDFQIHETGTEIDIESEDINQQVDEFERKMTTKHFYLFSIPVIILKNKKSEDVDVFSFEPLDTDIRLNISALYEIFGSYGKEDLVYEFLQEYTEYQESEKLSIPIKSESDLLGLWNILKSKLRLTDAVFGDNSFNLCDIFLTLQARSNYFLVEDLTKMSKMDEASLEDSSLSAWFKTDGLGNDGGTPKESELYFPFVYDKFQSATTSILGNRASIIQGPPGTGKSETIANLISHITVQGNSVLFVSQKAQAIRVVKDKLKTLEVPLFFGYVPSSKYEGDEDTDTISAQLAQLDNYVADIKEGPVSDLKTFTDSSNQVNTRKEKIIRLESEYYEISTKIKNYHYLQSIAIQDPEKIITGLTESVMDRFYKLRDKFLYNQNLISQPLGSKLLEEDLFVGKIYSDSLRKIHGSVNDYGYDRPSSFNKYFHNFLLKFRIGQDLKILPLEIYTLLQDIFDANISKHKKLDQIMHLIKVCEYFEAAQENKSIKNEIEKIEQSLGCTTGWTQTFSEFTKINNKTVSQFISDLSEYYQLKAKLNAIRSEISELKANITHEKPQYSRKEIIATYIRNIISERIKKFVIGQANIANHQILKVLQKSFSKSKKAFKTFEKIKKDSNNFLTLQKIVPVWIMDLDDASRLLPLEKEIFDYVIFDEASQCNVAYTLPSMFRAKRSIFVGDSEQMRPSITFSSNRSFEELAVRHKVPEFMQIKPMSSSAQSVLDIAGIRFGIPKTLQYHYRSPSELIGFSSKYFYEPKGKRLIALNNKYLTYKDTNRVMMVHQVQSEGDISDNTNIVEAKKALELYEELKKDSSYIDKSFAILAFFNDQANLIRKVFEDAGYKEDENLKIAIIEGIQGDEKDIVIYSFVIRDASQKRQYLPLTGESGNILSEVNAGRINVAFSRAKLQVHCIISMPIASFPSGIWIKKYLEYVQDFGEINNYSKLEKFDSYFEEEFYSYMKSALGPDYKIQNQVQSCGFKIDFVVTNTKTGKRLAVECDGPTHFESSVDESYGIYVDRDIDRQMVLESAGWKFYRIGYSDWCNSNEEEKNNFIDFLKNSF